MPVYVYRNLRTGATFEVEQRMSDAALSADPVTGDPVKRLIQPVGIAFKGAGFYVTDSRSSATRGATKEKKAAEGASTGATADASTSATPAASSAAAPVSSPATSTSTVSSAGAAD
jgi:predicted nucleic acid-binding Zn ribbon protein